MSSAEPPECLLRILPLSSGRIGELSPCSGLLPRAERPRRCARLPSRYLSVNSVTTGYDYWQRRERKKTESITKSSAVLGSLDAHLLRPSVLGASKVKKRQSLMDAASSQAPTSTPTSSILILRSPLKPCWCPQSPAESPLFQDE